MSDLAQVLHDIRKGRVRRPPTVAKPIHSRITAAAAVATGPLVDATFVYETYLKKPEIALYEDHPSVLPPWSDAFIGYRNEHGNANITYVFAMPWEKMGTNTWESEHGYDLTESEWCLWLWMFGGGRMEGGTRQSPTFGPIALTQIAVAADGTPLDIHWTDLMMDGRPEKWDWSRLSVLGVYNLLNCRNTSIREQRLPGHEYRAERRLGIRSHVIHVTSNGSRADTSGQSGQPNDAPLHSVRGHMAHYGACCRHHEPRGLLFGKITARVWVPQHARGDTKQGEVDQTFIVGDNPATDD